jgi:hypothetical protein
MKEHVLFRARVAVGLALAAWFLVVGQGCAGGSGLEGGRTSCGRSRGSGSAPEPEPVPLSRYVGTWKGSWTAAGNFPALDPLPRGEMTLTVDPTGAFSGQLTDTATNRTGSVFGKITAQGWDGTADITAAFGERNAREFTQIVIDRTSGHLNGSMLVPVDQASAPDGPPVTSTLASYDLTRQ